MSCSGSGTLSVSKRSEKSSLNFVRPCYMFFSLLFLKMFCPNADVFKVAFKIFVVRDFDKQNLSHQENSQISRVVL